MLTYFENFGENICVGWKHLDSTYLVSLWYCMWLTGIQPMEISNWIDRINISEHLKHANNCFFTMENNDKDHLVDWWDNVMRQIIKWDNDLQRKKKYENMKNTSNIGETEE